MPSSAHLLHALIAELRDADDSDRAEVAALLQPHLELVAPESAVLGSGWLTTEEAADYLGMSRSWLNRLASAREVPFEQDKPGGKRWFKRAELDAWRRGEGQSRRVA